MADRRDPDLRAIDAALDNVATPRRDPDLAAVDASMAIRPERRFVIWSIEHNAWWRPGWLGYTEVLAEAGRYGEVEADEILKRANHVAVNECRIPVEAVELAGFTAQMAALSAQVSALESQVRQFAHTITRTVIANATNTAEERP